MFPCEANLYMTPVYFEDYYRKKVDFFDKKVNCATIASLKDAAIEEFTTHTLRCFQIPVDSVLAEPVLLKTMNCTSTCILESRKTVKSFSFKILETQNTMFSWKYNPEPDETTVVEIACSYDGWQKHKMNYQEGRWKISLSLTPGTHQYKYIINGTWKCDPNRPAVQDNARNMNNTIEVQKKNKRHFNGFGAWFDVVFRGSDPNKSAIVLSTDPRTGYLSHWKQDICLFRRPIPIADSDISGTVTIEQMEDYKRHFCITISPDERDTFRKKITFPEQQWTF